MLQQNVPYNRTWGKPNNSCIRSNFAETKLLYYV